MDVREKTASEKGVLTMTEYVTLEQAATAFAIQTIFSTNDCLDMLYYAIQKGWISPSDVTTVRHGRWIMGTGENGLQTGHRECSQCGEIVKYGYSLYGVHNFCNYCGAKMNDEVNT